VEDAWTGREDSGWRFSLARTASLRDTSGMSAIPQPVRVPVEEYLTTVYRPDCDYVDGEVLERNLGEKEHSILQRALILLFGMNRDAWRVEVFPEQRVQVGPSRYRVPDITVLSAGLQWQRVLRVPALLFIEILSPEDRWGRIRERVEDYFTLGTENVWIIDPELRRGYVCMRRGFQEPESGVLEIPGTPICVVLSELFSELDRV
jgi:Uma2 family endonuclease